MVWSSYSGLPAILLCGFRACGLRTYLAKNSGLALAIAASTGQGKRPCGPPRAHVVTAIAILFRNPVAVHDRRAGREIAVRHNSAENLALAAEVEPHNLKRNLRFVAMRKHLERRLKARVRDHIRSQLDAFWAFGQPSCDLPSTFSTSTGWWAAR